MIYSKRYQSPLGEITLNSDGENLTVLCFEEGRDYWKYVRKDGIEQELPIFALLYLAIG